MRDLEQKVQDQEEELDEQAGQIQMLEQVRLQRLEELLLCKFDWIRKAYWNSPRGSPGILNPPNYKVTETSFFSFLKSYENPVPPRFAGKKCVQRETLANAMALKKIGITYCSSENCTKNMPVYRKDLSGRLHC